MSPRWISFIAILVLWIIVMVWKIFFMKTQPSIGAGITDCFEIFGLFGLGAGALIVHLILNLVIK